MLDGGVYFTGIFTVLIFIPQFVDVWFSNKIVGVSLLSWTGLFISSIFWMFYGVVHKTKPLIFINVLSGIIQFLIILGILLHR